ncbi:hypothetical protein PIB30_050545 [Stylosanthes scabra]|uniref:Uncharacterized protein n=1 Tax=Stylosanthes scabra TaxID=79078 RepID=A0ABU6YGG8_9FABA|nr:hypothetical protein [Stylosanthes scabra]
MHTHHYSDASYGSEQESASTDSAPSSHHSSGSSSDSVSLGYGSASSGSASDGASDDDLVNRLFRCYRYATSRQACKFWNIRVRFLVTSSAVGMIMTYRKSGCYIIGMAIENTPPALPQLINYTCMIQSLDSIADSQKPKVWFIPYGFARDKRNGGTCGSNQEGLRKEMDDSNQLPRTYPWYLMLLDVKYSHIYCLDVCGDDEDRERRAADMEKIFNALSQLFSSKRNIINFYHTSLHPGNWGYVIYPEGLPRNVSSANSAAWMLSWLSKKGGEHLPSMYTCCLIPGELGTQRSRRLRAALYLVNW